MPETFVVCSNEYEVKVHESRSYGSQMFEVSIKDINALLEGRILTAMINDEYSVFIKLSDKYKKDHDG